MGGLATGAAPRERRGRPGIGTRSATAGQTGLAETRLHLDVRLADTEGFVEAVLRQHELFASFDHPQVASVRAVERRPVGHHRGLDVVSLHAHGESLADLLTRLSTAGTPLTAAAALFVIRELLTAVTALHGHGASNFHGALTLDAIVITPDQRLIVRDHLFGRALGRVTLTPLAWWKEHGLAVPATPGIPAFTPLTDQFQIGVVALSVFLGRPLTAVDDLDTLPTLLAGVTETTIDGEAQPLGAALGGWLARTLLVAPAGPFRSLTAACEGLEDLLDSEAGYVAAPIGLDVEPAHLAPAPAADPAGARSYDPFVPAAPPRLAPAEPPEVDAHPRFIIESNDGRASELASDPGSSSYEPFATLPPTASGPSGQAAPSTYQATLHPAVDQVTARTAEAGSAASPDGPPAQVPIAATPLRASPAPIIEPPRPFWDMIQGPARPAQATATVLPFHSPPSGPAASEASSAAPSRRPTGQRPAFVPADVDIVVNAPPPTLGDVTPVVTSQVSTKTSSLLRAAVEEFEQPARHAPAPPPKVAPALPPAVAAAPPPTPTPPQDPVAHDPVPPLSAKARGIGGQHAPRSDVQNPPAAPRRSSLGLGDDDVTPPSPRRGSRRMLMAAALAIVMGGGLGAGYLYLWPRGPSEPVGEPGRLRLESKPAGASVRVNGVEKGLTPLTLAVPPGAYRIEFERGEQVRSLSTTVTSNNETFQAVTLYPPGPPGEIAVSSVPAGAAVSVNGEPRGTTPATLDGLPPGEYSVVVENAVARVERKVEVLPSSVATIDIPLSGLVEVLSPIPLSISDRDRPLGQLRSGRLAVAAGVRRLQLTNVELGFEETRDVEVEAGGVTRVTVTPPQGVLNITADTETDVYLDGRPIGLTPLTNLSLALGVHEVTFRHATWGEQNYTVLVGLTTPSRLHVTMMTKSPKAQQRRPAPVRRRY